MQNIETDAKDFNESDAVVILRGTNNITEKNSCSIILEEMVRALMKTSKTNVIICGVLHRFDQPHISSKIKRINEQLNSLTKQFSNGAFLSLSSL